MRNGRCNSCVPRQGSPPRWWECPAWNTRKPTHGWWAWLRQPWTNSANFFHAAKALEAEGRNKNPGERESMAKLKNAVGKPVDERNVALINWLADSVFQLDRARSRPGANEVSRKTKD